MASSSTLAAAPLQFSSIPDCIADFAAGKFLIVLDAPSRENEGDLIVAAARLTPAQCAFLVRHSSGYLCAPMSAARAAALALPPLVAPAANADPNRTAYAVSVDADAPALSTGISAHDRALTCNVLADPAAGPAALRRPGHVLPLTARPGGVRVRRGHTEAGWEFARLAGFEPAVAVIGELVADGEVDAARARTKAEYHGSGMMRGEECVEFGRKWDIRCCTIEDLVAYVEEKEGALVDGKGWEG